MRTREMRDIRPDLKERLAAAQKRRSDAERVLEQADSEVKLLSGLLELEASRALDPLPSSKEKTPDRSLTDFILELLHKEPTPKESIRDYAVKAGFFGPGETPGRAVHATLVNLERVGRVLVLADGRYADAQLQLITESERGRQKSTALVVGTGFDQAPQWLADVNSGHEADDSVAR